jgi:ComF family protein
VRSDLPGGTPIGLPSETPAPLLQLEWCAPFTGVVRRALHALKYGGERRLAAPLGAVMADRWRRAGVGADLIVPVPVHADRARERGYDQAVLLAGHAARELRLPMRPMLERMRATQAQYRLGHAERAMNVRDAFGLTRGDARARSPTGRWILLVDDVVTTGSTLASCAEALLAAGAVAVSAITVARER